MSEFKVSEPYRPRPISFDGVRDLAGWRMKMYAITYGPEPLDRACYEQGLELARDTLPQRPIQADRPGVGFIIAHQGRGWHYLVLNWWAHENEYFNRVFVRPRAGDVPWRAATGGESACVWDLEVIWFERQAYVETVLSPLAGPDIEAYLAKRLEVTL